MSPKDDLKSDPGKMDTNGTHLKPTGSISTRKRRRVIRKQMEEKKPIKKARAKTGMDIEKQKTDQRIEKDIEVFKGINRKAKDNRLTKPLFWDGTTKEEPADDEVLLQKRRIHCYEGYRTLLEHYYSMKESEITRYNHKRIIAEASEYEKKLTVAEQTQIMAFIENYEAQSTREKDSYALKTA